MLDENLIYEAVKTMVHREVEFLAAKKAMGWDDIQKLERLTKIYAILKDDLRNDRKAGLLGVVA